LAPGPDAAPEALPEGMEQELAEMVPLAGAEQASDLDLDVAASIGLVDDELAELADRLFDFPTENDRDDDSDAE
jgi:hypothetical protein